MLFIFSLFFLLLFSCIVINTDDCFARYLLNDEQHTRRETEKNQTTQHFTLGPLALSLSWHYHTTRQSFSTHTSWSTLFLPSYRSHLTHTNTRTLTLALTESINQLTTRIPYWGGIPIFVILTAANLLLEFRHYSHISQCYATSLTQYLLLNLSFNFNRNQHCQQ